MLYPSADVVKIIRACEIAFKCLVSGDDFKNPKILNKSSTIKVKTRNNVIQAISGDVFNSLEEHILILTWVRKICIHFNLLKQLWISI